ncbi:MAG: hypothetical protein GWN61_17740 [candidate division Zixibacteria bacterium]|nr:hypothetical protein [candidate division Zixibacteria bacterium]NIU15815.1 hypothetical protein [candidate division Zixibacteria bacterium]NIV07962.1 hypothetical protein [candidate division Zixibacteria bacterium]NIW47228.1 hypothetical protein [Gammaproteobacteria bacterium]
MKNNSNPNKIESRFSHVFWTYTGTLLLAVTLVVLLHETGHYLAYRWRGYAASVHINPFMGATSTRQTVQPEDFVYIILGGTVFNLSLASIAAILLRYAKNINWILIKMYATMAFLIEGMVLIAGLFFEETVTDFSWLISLGVHPVFVGILGVLLIVIGGLLNYGAWRSVGVTPQSPRWQILLLNTSFLVYVLAGFAIGMVISPIDIQFIRRFLFVAMLLHWLYLGLRVILNPYIMPRLQRRMQTGHLELTGNSGRLSMALGCASWVISFLILN